LQLPFSKPATPPLSNGGGSSHSSGSAPPRAIKPPPPVESIVGHAGGATIVLSNMSAAAQKRYDALNPKEVVSDEKPPPPRRLILEGLLSKKSPSMFASMQPRYFVLHSDKLEYWKTLEDRKTPNKAPQGLIPLYSVKRVVNCGTVKGGKNTRFDITVGDAGATRTFELATSTPYECENWCAAILDAVRDLNTAGMSVTAAGSGADATKFWKQSEKLEALLTAPLPVHISSAGKYTDKNTTDEEARPPKTEKPFIRLPKEQTQPQQQQQHPSAANMAHFKARPPSLQSKGF
jgi:hypothetical protein